MKIDLPDRWVHETHVTVRVTDLNYGNHLANQNILTYAQEARVAYFGAFGQSELKFGGHSLIQADAAVIYKGEGFYGDHIRIRTSARVQGRSSFDIYYLMERLSDGKPIAEVRTGMVCYDYDNKRVVPIAEEVLESGLFLAAD